MGCDRILLERTSQGIEYLRKEGRLFGSRTDFAGLLHPGVGDILRDAETGLQVCDDIYERNTRLVGRIDVGLQPQK
ncbi:Uncharacterised protein [Pseudomonas putida]|nr:Uncharacterised protein [Pseudomonas putida]